ncbi:constitutive coactivator of peroxisome proliferator-activated receptor gamma isoform X2 [Choloepus didactylus]|uniref:constitutive coactivator of peroxisome proliferator-activated receptor gamma isoform X2 n=1 Tax=Choloepus didactylus TaxID=27675 RepID=UPI0018A0875E|nr:constitutive coactivator of peroxisome proliferator-activated receptor gamma isoform X2 [Choloepus didactylus]
MGVRGLQGFVGSSCPHICTVVNFKELAEEYRSKHPGCTPAIVVDAMCCLRYWYTPESWICGGQWREYYSSLRDFVKTFTAVGIQLIFFFDGMVEQDKRNEWVKRRLKNSREIARIFHYIKSHREQPGRNMFFIPSGLAIFTRFALKTLGQKTLCSLQEADYEVASYGLQNNCLGILGEDTDYLIYNTCPYFSISELCLESLDTVMLHREKLCETLNLNITDLPLLACLLGNDIIPEGMFESFRYKCLYSYTAIRENLDKKGNIILAVADHISKVLHLYQGEKKLEEMLPLGPNKALFYKGVASYLLPGQKSPWFFQKLRDGVTLDKQVVSMSSDPESKQVPTCTDPKSKQEVPMRTDPKSKQEVPMRTFPKSKLEVPMRPNVKSKIVLVCTEPKSRLGVPMRPNIKSKIVPVYIDPTCKLGVPMHTESESKHEVPMHRDPSPKHGVPMHTDPGSKQEVPMHTDPGSKQEVAMLRDPSSEQEVPMHTGPGSKYEVPMHADPGSKQQVLTCTDPESKQEVLIHTDPASKHQLPMHTNCESKQEVPVHTDPESKQKVPTHTDPEPKQEVFRHTDPESKQDVPMSTDPVSKQDVPTCTDPESKQDVPTCTDPESKQDVPTCTDPESKQDIPMSTDPESKQGFPTCTGPESKQDVPTCTDPEFKQDVPMCIDTESKQEVSMYTDHESKQEVSMCTDPESKQEVSMCSEPESKQEIPMCTDPSSKQEVTMSSGPETKQILPIVTDPESKLETPMHTNPEIKQVEPMNMEPEINQKVTKNSDPEIKQQVAIYLAPEIKQEVTIISDPEILKVAKAHHVQGESYLVYNIMCSGEIECGNTLEDELDQALPSQAFVYRPVRQRVYWLILGDCRDGVSACPTVKEWFVYSGNPLKHPDLVQPLQMNIPGGTPSLKRLWLNQQPGIQGLRFDALLACFNLSSAKEELQALEDPFKAFCCLLIYLFVQVDSLCLEDLHAFIAQAVCLQGKSASQLTSIQLDYVNSRAVQLGSLLVRGLTTLILVNSACGFPLRMNDFMPWNIFDGKLFHQKYLQAEKGFTVEVLVEQNRAQLTRFHCLKTAVCKACVKDNRRILTRQHWIARNAARWGRQGSNYLRTGYGPGHSNQGQHWGERGSGSRQYEHDQWRRYPSSSGWPN